MTDSTLLKPHEVARRLGMSVAWVRDHSERAYPRLPVIRLGASLRYHPDDIEKFVEDLRTHARRKAL